MDILTRAFVWFRDWIAGIEGIDYRFLFRLCLMYMSACVAVAVSFLQFHTRNEQIHWALAFVAALASFSIPVAVPCDRMAKVYVIVLGALATVGAAGLAPCFLVEAKAKQGLVRRLSYWTAAILVLVHLALRRYLE